MEAIIGILAGVGGVLMGEKLKNNPLTKVVLKLSIYFLAFLVGLIITLAIRGKLCLSYAIFSLFMYVFFAGIVLLKWYINKQYT